MDLSKRMYGLISVFFFSVSLSNGVFAEDVKVLGSIKHTLKLSCKHKATAKEIQLLHVKLSDEAKKIMARRAQDALTHTNQFAPQSLNYLALPASFQLGMNKTPVLNQGIHGSCVTFAITGAVDALIGKGDYVSQLCQLQLGSYLAKQGRGYSAWEGASAITVINQMEQFGIANKTNQHAVGCGGLYHYPKNSAHSDDSFMELDQFQKISEPVFGKILNWSDVVASFSANSESEQALTEVKQALNSGDRLVFATLLPRTDLGNAGAVGKYKTWFAKDTWVLTPAIVAGTGNIVSAHELIIVGYDDNAVAVDTDGVKHTGLLTLRNSWGTCAGYYGEFYMSYDYFKLLAYDVKRFTQV